MKKYIAIHTYHDSDAKKRFWMGTKHNQTTDIEWAKKWNYKKARCTATWVGSDDFFFFQWEADKSEDIVSALSEQGFDEFIFTATYEIDLHIDVNNLTGEVPYKAIHYLDEGS